MWPMLLVTIGAMCALLGLPLKGVNSICGRLHNRA